MLGTFQEILVLARSMRLHVAAIRVQWLLMFLNYAIYFVGRMGLCGERVDASRRWDMWGVRRTIRASFWRQRGEQTSKWTRQSCLWTSPRLLKFSIQFRSEMLPMKKKIDIKEEMSGDRRVCCQKWPYQSSRNKMMRALVEVIRPFLYIAYNSFYFQTARWWTVDRQRGSIGPSNVTASVNLFFWFVKSNVRGWIGRKSERNG